MSKRTLGRGYASSERLGSPSSESSVFLWQGIIESPSDKVQIQFPIPLDWYQSVEKPMLRVMCSADVPVNGAVSGVWACRRVNCKLRPTSDGKAVRSKQGLRFNHSNYPMFERIYDLKRLPKDAEEVSDDLWVFELTYQEIGDYPPGRQFSPQQRVAIAAELFDLSEKPSSPQSAIQQLPIAATMNHLSISSEIQVPIVIRQ